jgi:hypothetical protein
MNPRWGSPILLAGAGVGKERSGGHMRLGAVGNQTTILPMERLGGPIAQEDGLVDGGLADIGAGPLLTR